MLTRSNRLRRLCVLTALASLGAVTVPTGASATPCVSGKVTQAFADFGDPAWYFLAPGGSFEGSLNWAHGGSVAQVSGNEPFMLAGEGHTRSLRLGEGGRVVTPRLCVTPQLPHLRFVAKAIDDGQLDVEVRVYGPDGQVTDSSSGGVSPDEHQRWAPSRFVDLNTDGLERGEVGVVDVRFRSQGAWLLDDVFIDPYKRG